MESLAGLAGIIFSSKTGSAQSNIGVGYETDAIAACVIGGTSFAGGVSTIPGTVVGGCHHGRQNNRQHVSLFHDKNLLH